MKCIKCGKEMKAVKKDLSRNSLVKPNIKYLREVFHCEEDDVWINVETPVKKSSI